MTTKDKDKGLYLDASNREALRIFARCGRWGTCVGCPQDGEGHVYPEFCSYTARYDHQLAINDLTDSIKRGAERARIAARERERERGTDG